MPEHVYELFDEYAAAYARGERPEAREFLARAGGEADELARLLDVFLARPSNSPGGSVSSRDDGDLSSSP